MNYPKSLIEVDLPIRTISEHARREKSIRHGHISTFHIWWARRPLAACRSVICASLWPDPADSLCPEKFKVIAKKIMIFWGKNCVGYCSQNSSQFFSKLGNMDESKISLLETRKALLAFIGDFANWDNATNPEFISVARLLTTSAKSALVGEDYLKLSEKLTFPEINSILSQSPSPLLVDPFAGGGAIPLEGARCGAETISSDLNPISVLLNKLMLEMIPESKGNPSSELVQWADKLRSKAIVDLGDLYPPKGEDRPIGYLWARTVKCEGPNCGAELPLLGQMWLSKKAGRKVGLAVEIDPKNVSVEIKVTYDASEVSEPIVKGGATLCPLCGYSTSSSAIRKQLRVRSGGTLDARMVTVISTREGLRGRLYREPEEADLIAVKKARQYLDTLLKKNDKNVKFFDLSEPTPDGAGSGAGRAFSQHNYGIYKFSDLYTSRQLLALGTFARLIQNAPHEGCDALTQRLLALVLGRLNDLSMSLCRWLPSIEAMASANGGQNRMPVVFDFVEANPFGGSGGDWNGQVDWVRRVVDHISLSIYSSKGTAIRSPAQNPYLPSGSVDLLFTDPPYYDAFPYSDLSDFFIVWFKRALGTKEFEWDQELSPKEEEIVVYDVSHGGKCIKDKKYFREEMTKTFKLWREVCKPGAISTIVFANKTTSGWEALLQSIVDGGWMATASWPIDTERPNRQRAIGSAALGSSVHVVCRPRSIENGLTDDSVGSWREVLSEIPKKIEVWLPRLAAEGIVGADAIFACLGPALESFSRYATVEKANGEKVTLKEFLETVWAEVAKQALNMIFDGVTSISLEEDARLTAMWLWTLRTDSKSDVSKGDKIEKISGYNLEYDAARKIAQGLGCHLENMINLVEIKGQTATLKSAGNRAHYLFGKEDVNVPKKFKKQNNIQGDLFLELDMPTNEELEKKHSDFERPNAGRTVLDQLHQSMILFGAGRGEALKRFLVDDGVGSNPQLWSLAQSLSALYPSQTEEKRWVDGVLARKKGLGF